MIKRIGALLGVSGGFAAVIAGAILSGRISDSVALWLFPALFALFFVAVGAVAFFVRLRPLVWLAGAGLVGQIVGWLLLFFDHLEHWRHAVFFAFGVVLVVGLVLLVAWIFLTLRARWLERKMIEGVGGAPGASQQEVKAVREGMQEALRMLQRAGRGRQAIYMLPWYLVIGRPQAGKTVAIKNSGLGLPVRRDWVKGVGGTRTCDWFFTNDMIFLDTPGRWVVDGTDKSDRDYWTELLDLLRKHRGRRPLDGLVVVVPAEDLLGKSEKQVQEQAGKIREVVDLMQERLRFRIPVYLLISKTDLVGGFVEFFRGLPAQRRQEILGWSHTEPDQGEPVALIAKGMQRIVRHLHAYRLEMIARVGSRTRARRLFFFPEEFKRLTEPLMAFADVFFSKDRYHEAPVFRGFYFTSGTQGEGTPLSRAMADFAGRLGVRASAATPEADDEPKRSYFLLDLFRDLMLRDEGLIGRTAGHWLRQRRSTMIGAFLPAGLALGFVVMCAIGLLTASNVASRAARDVPQVASNLDAMARQSNPKDIERALEMTGRLRDLHRKMTGFSLWRGWGMRRGLREYDGAADQVLVVLRDRFNEAVLRPTFDEGERIGTGGADESTARSCADRMQLLSSVVWLRMARRAQSEDELAGLDPVWGLDEDRSEDVRRELLRQYRYIEQRLVGSSTLLPGFALDRVARAIADECATVGSGSALGKYRFFLDSCRSGAVSQTGTERCYGLLQSAISLDEEDFELFGRRLRNLRSDLETLQGEETSAAPALAALASISEDEMERGDCLTRFSETILPKIEAYAKDQGPLIDQCRQRVAMDSDRGRQFLALAQTMKEQAEGLVPREQELQAAFATYENECRSGMLSGMTSLEIATLRSVIEDYRRWKCLPDASPPPVVASEEPSAPVVNAAPVRPAGLRWFEVPVAVPADFTLAAWQAKQGDWSGQAAAVKEMDAASRQLEEQRIAREVGAYAQRFSAAWRSYLERLRVKTGGNPAVVLRELSQARTEYDRVLRPAADVVSATRNVSEGYLSPMRGAADGLSGLDGFLEGSLGEYLRLVGEVGEDLERCRNDVDFCQGYRGAIQRKDPEASLVRAEKWLQDNAGPRLAGGRIDPVLQAPFEAARRYFSSGDQIELEWNGLRELWGSKLVGRYPFSTSPDAEVAEADPVVRVFGRGTGYVPSLAAMARQGKLAPEAKAWVERADAISRALFADGSDEPKLAEVRVRFAGYNVEPKKDEDELKIEKIVFFLGGDRTLEWEKAKDEAGKEVTLKVPLLGDEAAESAYVQALGAGKKAFLKRMVGSNYKKGEEQMIATGTGPWAPVKLLRLGAGGGGRQLSYTAELEARGKKSVKLFAKFDVAGADADALLALATEGLAAPPQDGVTR